MKSLLQRSHIFSDMVTPDPSPLCNVINKASTEPYLFRYGNNYKSAEFFRLAYRFNGAISFQIW